MTKPVKSLSERVVGHTQPRGDLRARRRIRFVWQQFFQGLIQKRVARRAVLFLQSVEDVLDERRSPASLVQSIGAQRINKSIGGKTGALSSVQFFERD